MKEELFRILQKILSKLTFLAHFDSKKTLYINLDVSKRFDFDVIIYYVSYSRGKEANLKSFHTFRANKSSSKEEEPSSTDYSNRSDVKLILFLSRLLKNIETRY